MYQLFVCFLHIIMKFISYNLKRILFNIFILYLYIKMFYLLNIYLVSEKFALS